MKKVFIIAGEASGDLYAKEIIKKLQNNNIEVFAMGSKNVQETQAKIIQDSTELSVTGIIEVVKVYSKIKKALDNIQKNLLIKKPDLLILIDYQEFNFRLAKFAKANGIKVLFFIGPQFWAWRPKRIKKFKNIVDKMAVIFPFEEEPYKKLGIDVSFRMGKMIVYKRELEKVKDALRDGIADRNSAIYTHRMPDIKTFG